jgi:hypothetical protein
MMMMMTGWDKSGMGTTMGRIVWCDVMVERLTVLLLSINVCMNPITYTRVTNTDTQNYKTISIMQ